MNQSIYDYKVATKRGESITDNREVDAGEGKKIKVENHGNAFGLNANTRKLARKLRKGSGGELVLSFSKFQWNQ